jgi:hypothetical protein
LHHQRLPHGAQQDGGGNSPSMLRSQCGRRGGDAQGRAEAEVAVVNAVVKGVARARVNSMDPRRWPCSSDAAPFSAAAGAGRLEELARPWRGKARDARCSRVCASLSPEDFLVGRIQLFTRRVVKVPIRTSRRIQIGRARQWSTL